MKTVPLLFRRWHTLALVLAAAVSAGAETMEMTTYYPAPTGNYNRVSADTVVLRPQTAVPASPREGMMYLQQDTSVPAENQLNIYSNGAWRRVLLAGGRVLASATLSHNHAVTWIWLKVGGLMITFKTTKRGLYYISWGGTARINARNGKDSSFRVRHLVGTLIQQMSVEDEDDDFGTSNDVPIDGATILFLDANRTYNILIDARKKGLLPNVNDTTALQGMWLKAEELLTF